MPSRAAVCVFSSNPAVVFRVRSLFIGAECDGLSGRETSGPKTTHQLKPQLSHRRPDFGVGPKLPRRGFRADMQIEWPSLPQQPRPHPRRPEVLPGRTEPDQPQAEQQQPQPPPGPPPADSRPERWGERVSHPTARRQLVDHHQWWQRAGLQSNRAIEPIESIEVLTVSAVI